MGDEFSSDEFKKILIEKEEQIKVRTENELQVLEGYKKLHVGLISFYNKNAITDFIAILIERTEIENFNLECDISVPLNENTNYHLVNRNFEILNSDKKELGDEIDAESFYKELSKSYCVFLITPEGINPFIDGENIGTLVFYKKHDYRAWKKLAEISDLISLFEKYRKHITYRYNYDNFFVSNSGKKSLYEHLLRNKKIKISKEDFTEANSQLLENRPEDRFRESLRIFLRDNLRRDILFGKEYILENFKRLDINIYDDYGDLYFIEVKWVGKSIHADGNSIETEYDSKHINPAAIKQTLKYIKALYDNEQNIKIGYLAVFDARYENLEDTTADFKPSEIDEEHQKYLGLFKKIPDFRVLNTHPN